MTQQLRMEIFRGNKHGGPYWMVEISEYIVARSNVPI
jgi:hypothetical protein